MSQTSHTFEFPPPRPRLRLRLAGLLFVGLLAAAPQLVAPDALGEAEGRAARGAPDASEQPRTLGLPPRPSGAATGTDFARRTTGMTGKQRQGEAVAEILRGNVPVFQRTLVPVDVEAVLSDGATHEATVWVMPDYLAIGSDADYLRMPLTLPSISRICEHLDALPPTPRLVDAIWENAQRHLQPSPMPPGPQMRSSRYYLQHRMAISKQLPSADQGDLVAGHKKDVVLTNRLARKPGRIAIYGWHRTDGEPIQPLSTIHGAAYADYSHGLRLVAGTVWVDGAERRLRDVLADPFLAPLLSDEGVIADPPRLLRGKG